MNEVTLGGDRLGSGKKQKVTLQGFERSTHDLSYVWQNTQAPGTLVPFMVQLALPGDTFDINLNADVKTHPTIGPLFGSFKLQLDVFECPIRLYVSQLHNNKLKIGNDMSSIKLPQLDFQYINPYTNPEYGNKIPVDLQQISSSSLLSYLGIRGIGNIPAGAGFQPMVQHIYKNAIPYLAYWEIFKNYYSNKQEDNAYFVSYSTNQNLMDALVIDSAPVASGQNGINLYAHCTAAEHNFQFDWYGATVPTKLYLNYIDETAQYPVIYETPIDTAIWTNGTHWSCTANWIAPTAGYVRGVTCNDYAGLNIEQQRLHLCQFVLSNIDDMRESLLSSISGDPYIINSNTPDPYGSPLNKMMYFESLGHIQSFCAQEGLAIKTYQSDIFNNWINTEWIDGAGGINEITAVDTSGGSFEINALNLAYKVNQMLMRIAVSGGTYNDWLEAVYDHKQYGLVESPIYHGGLSKEIVFQEVINMSSDTYNQQELTQRPLGSLAGRGVMSEKHKGGQVSIKVNEPSYIIGIVSITPRLTYSQGNEFFTSHQNMNDLHKPNLDSIGFQDLVTDKMASFDTGYDNQGNIIYKSAGKQPAWIDYMTNFNKSYGNFADNRSEMYMTLNRNYGVTFLDTNQTTITDLTTYIDPTKYNYAFAQTDLGAMNFWVHIGNEITARRKMSAKIMPTL